jgi:hypothetical protein
LSRFVGLTVIGDMGSGMSFFCFPCVGATLTAGSAAALELDAADDRTAATGVCFTSVLAAAAALDFILSLSVRGGRTTTAPAAAAAFFSLVSWSNFSMICSRV